MINVKVNYTELNSNKVKIIEFEHRNQEDLNINLFNKMDENQYQNVIKNNRLIVFVLAIDVLNEIFVTDFVEHVKEYLEWGFLYDNANDDFIDIENLVCSIYEYNSFEEAYNQALILKSDSNLCYKKQV